MSLRCAWVTITVPASLGLPTSIGAPFWLVRAELARDVVVGCSVAVGEFACGVQRRKHVVRLAPVIGRGRVGRRFERGRTLSAARE
jgi:hypothetical protein